MKAAERRVLIDRFIRSFGQRALELYQRLAAGQPDRRCRTCAFRVMEERGVDGWRGWQRSLMGLIRSADPSFADTRPQVFVCHRSRKVAGAYAPHKKPRFCAGYAVLAGRPEFKHAVADAAHDAAKGAA